MTGEQQIKKDVNYTYSYKPAEWKDGLRMHLIKQEIIWVAKNGGGWVQWLAPYAGDGKAMKGFLRAVGFKIKREYTCDDHWIELVGGVSVTIEEGFCSYYDARRKS